MNDTNNSNNQNGFEQNQQQPLNVIPPTNNVDNKQESEMHNFDDAFINRNITNNNINQTQNNFINNNPINNQNIFPSNSNQSFETQNNVTDESDVALTTPQNKFINNNIDTTSTSLNNLNIDGSYHNMPKVDYSKDPKVQENIKKRNTITITGEGKVFIIIIIILLLFIFVLPTVFDYIRNLTY